MMKYILNIILFTLFIFLKVYGQDIHFSQYYASPLLLNPAMTGHFDGDYRVGLIYRNQWSSFTVPYVTYSGFFDRKINKEIIKDDFLGVGLVLYSDKSGIAELTTQTATASFAYHKRIGADARHLVSLGIEAGIVQKSVNYDDLRFHNQYESVFYKPELESGEIYSSNSFLYPNIHIGGLWNYLYDERLKIFSGLSLFNLTTPNESFYEADNNSLNMRCLFNAGAIYDLNEKTTLLPEFLFAGQTKDKEFLIGSNALYNLKKSPVLNVSLVFGAWYRVSDAIILVPGIVYNNYKFAFSYDINVSSLRAASNGKGAFEFSLIYLFNANPKLGIKTSVPCKRL
ncbi:MAG: PorP/SprF family type IX secretion system membrane protein [Bacteroidota bacterium]